MTRNPTSISGTDEVEAPPFLFESLRAGYARGYLPPKDGCFLGALTGDQELKICIEVYRCIASRFV